MKKTTLAIVICLMMTMGLLTACSGGGTDASSAPPAGQAQAAGSALPSKTLTYTVANKLGESVQELYISSVEDADWGEDLLGEELLEADRTKDIETSVGAEVDVLFTDDSGTEHELFELVLAEGCTLTLENTEDGYGATVRFGDGSEESYYEYDESDLDIEYEWEWEDDSGLDEDTDEDEEG